MIRAAFSHFHRTFLARSLRVPLGSVAAVAVRSRGANASKIAAATGVVVCATVLALQQQQRQPAQAASHAASALHKHFVADAAAQAAPAVVNILSVVKSTLVSLAVVAVIAAVLGEIDRVIANTRVLYVLELSGGGLIVAVWLW